MKEQFRNKKLQAEIKITFKRGDEKYQWSASTQNLLAHIQRITSAYMKQGITMTLRQLYYQLVAQDIIPNADEIYKRIGTLVTDAKYNGFLDWNALEDRGRPQSMSSQWDNVKSLVESAIAAYRLPRWKDQPFYVELFTEKDALSSVLQPLCEKYHIRLVVNKGYTSSSVMYELGKRVKRKLKAGKIVKLLYLGDHDPSGLDMLRDIEDRLTEMLEKGSEYTYSGFKIIPVALTRKQIEEFNPPPNPAKITDPRAKWYLCEHGDVSWEVDALKPEDMIRIVEAAIQKQIDLEKYNAWIEKEKEQAKVLEEFAEKMVKDEPDEDKQEPIPFDSSDMRTKIRVMSDIQEVQEEDTVEWYGYDKSDTIYECPICGHFADKDRDFVYDHIFDEHEEDEFNEHYNRGTSQDDE